MQSLDKLCNYYAFVYNFIFNLFQIEFHKTSSEMRSILVITDILIALTHLYLKLKSTYKFWKIRGINGPEPRLLFGNLWDVALLQSSIGTAVKKMYDDFPDEKVVGLFVGTKPLLLIKDAELIKDVLIKDFHNFASRGMTVFEKVEPLSVHLFKVVIRFKTL